MENFYPFADEMWPEFEHEEMTSNFGDMITAILTKTIDPRFLNDPYDD